MCYILSILMLINLLMVVSDNEWPLGILCFFAFIIQVLSQTTSFGYLLSFGTS